MQELHTDGTHLIMPPGEHSLPMICILTGEPVPQRKNPSNPISPTPYIIQHYSKRYPWRPIGFTFLALLIAAIFIPIAIPIQLIYLYCISLVLFIMIALFLGIGKDHKEFILLTHIKTPQTKLSHLFFFLARIFPIVIVALRESLNHWEIALAIGVGTMLYLISNRLNPSPFPGITSKLQNNLFHISGIHPNLLKTLPTQSSPKSC